MREWLNLMVQSRIVQYNAEAGTFYLPKQYRASLTGLRADTLPMFGSAIPILLQAHTQLGECFKKTGPLGKSTLVLYVLVSYGCYLLVLL